MIQVNVRGGANQLRIERVERMGSWQLIILANDKVVGIFYPTAFTVKCVPGSLHEITFDRGNGNILLQDKSDADAVRQYLADWEAMKNA